MNENTERMAQEQIASSRGLRDRLKVLVTKWHIDAMMPGDGDYYAGRESAYVNCADELMKLIEEP